MTRPTPVHSIKGINIMARHYIASLFVNTDSLATLAYSETVVDRAAVDAAVFAGDTAKAQSLLASGKVKSRTREHQGGTDAATLLAFAKKVLQSNDLHMVPVSSSPDCNVFGLARGEAPAESKPSKGK